MTNSFELLDFQSLSDGTLTLLPQYYQQAIELSREITHPQQQWQTYLNVLALSGFEQWLARREPNLSITQEDYTLWQPEITVGDFKVCLLVRGTLEDEVIEVPREVVDTPQYIAHFYIAIAVDEEIGYAQIEGVLRYDRLISLNLVAQSDRTYEIPFTCFDPDPEHLLLYLRCLDPAAISLPVASNVPRTSAALSQLRQQVINASLWLQNQLDEFAQTLSWQLLPTPLLATSSLRSLEELERIIGQLRQIEREISPQASGIYQNINLANNLLQLYAITEFNSTQFEWSLLIIVGNQEGNILPNGLKLQISDQETLLVEEITQINQEQNYLYARVIGNLDEQFSVNLLLNDESLTLPPFVFRPAQEG